MNGEILTEKHYMKNIGISYSYIRCEQRKDRDILIKFSKCISLIKFIEFEKHLHDLLDNKSDLVLSDSTNPIFRDYIHGGNDL